MAWRYTKHWLYLHRQVRKASTNLQSKEALSSDININGRNFQRDNWTNVTPNILSYLGRNLHLQPYHPLCFIKQRIVNYFYRQFVGRTGNAIFSVHENLDPVVSVQQNFDSLLTSPDHPSRRKTDCYYINSNVLLRGHTTAHQSELIKSGLNNFLMVGDVYRRDEIDSKHYPVFHQLDAVRLCVPHDEVFKAVNAEDSFTIFDKNAERTLEKQEMYTLEASKIMEEELKQTLIGLAQELFGKDVEYRWQDSYFPFTHPSWELEIFHKDDWIEMLGCGIMEHKILREAGAQDRIGWAFGLGLERLAMFLYNIPDIRLFWSTDAGFLCQFKNKSPYDSITFKPVSVFPPCVNDISFWLPEDKPYCPNDFYDLVRSIAGDLVEQIELIDEFTHPKTQKKSHCYRIVYRHMEKTFSQKEVNSIHLVISETAEVNLHVTVRR